MSLIHEFAQVPNAVALAGVLFGAAALLTGIWFFHAQRKIGAKAVVVLPLFGLDNNQSPFVVRITNTNTRAFKINSIGFEVFGRYVNRRKSCDYELTLGSGLLKTEKLLITEGDSTDVRFIRQDIAIQLANGIRDANIHLVSPDVKIWLYLTHGIKVLVEPHPELSQRLIAHISTKS